MEVEEKKHSSQEKSEDSAKLLQKLKEQLYSSNGSIRRQAGFNLSWLQEDGLDILKSVLFGGKPITTKTAAAYGLRKMRGRMKKMALEVFQEGLKHKDKTVKEVCTKALALMEKTTRKKPSAKKAPAVKLKIKEIPKKAGPRRRISAQPRNRRSLRK